MTSSQTAISEILVQTLQTSDVFTTEEETHFKGFLSSVSAFDLYNCLKEDVWKVICAIIDNSQPQEKSKAMTLLD